MRRIGIAVLALCASGSLSSCSMLIWREQFVPYDRQLDGWESSRGYRSTPPGSDWIIVFDGPTEQRLCAGGSELRISVREHYIDQVSVGPLLPIFPVFMGAGTHATCLSVDIRVESVREDSSFELDALRLSCGDSDVRLAPAVVAVIDEAGEQVADLDSGACISPAHARRTIRLGFDVAYEELDYVTLHLPPPDAAGTPGTITFRSGGAVVLAWTRPW